VRFYQFEDVYTTSIALLIIRYVSSFEACCLINFFIPGGRIKMSFLSDSTIVRKP